MKIDQACLKMFSHYDPDTGDFRRIAFISNQGKVYKRESAVRSRHQHGYYIAVVHGVRYRVHKLIFLYMTGLYPSSDVDHINGNRIDNRWSNLRLVKKVDNQRNVGLRSDSKSGHTGVYWYPPLRKYQAQITVSGCRKHLGYFSEISDAVVARKSAEKEYNFHPNHGERPSWGN